MGRLSRQTLVLRLFIYALCGIIARFVADITFDMALLLVILPLVFFENTSVTTSHQGIRRLALPAFLIQTMIVFK